MEKFQILLFYKYVEINDAEKLQQAQIKLCQKLNLRGRIIIANEGLNATLEGTKKNIEKYCQEILKDQRFLGTQFKLSQGTGNAFPKLSVKIRSEIVAGRLGKEDVNPNKITGKYLTAEELHQWILEKREIYIIDMRNNFEQEVGYFENSILPGMATFADLPRVLPKLKNLKNKTIVTVCTGGVRCEKASGFLVKNGFNKVYQLFGGIVTYMEKYPSKHFKGALYVFDGRVVMGFNLDDPKREIVGRCANCQKPSENYINCKDPFCNRHFITCLECLNGEAKILCPMGCRDYSKEHPEAFAFNYE